MPTPPESSRQTPDEGENPCDDFDWPGYIDATRIPIPYSAEERPTVTYFEAQVDVDEQRIEDIGETLGNLKQLRLLAGSSLQSLRSLGTSFRNLTVLWAARCGVVDVGGISSLPCLGELYVSFNEVSDLSPLSGHSALEVLDLEGNRVDDPSELAWLASCDNLRELTLSGNPVCKKGEYSKSRLRTMLPSLEWLDDEPATLRDVKEEETGRGGVDGEEPSLSGLSARGEEEAAADKDKEKEGEDDCMAGEPDDEMIIVECIKATRPAGFCLAPPDLAGTPTGAGRGDALPIGGRPGTAPTHALQAATSSGGGSPTATPSASGGGAGTGTGAAAGGSSSFRSARGGVGVRSQGAGSAAGGRPSTALPPNSLPGGSAATRLGARPGTAAVPGTPNVGPLGCAGTWGGGFPFSRTSTAASSAKGGAAFHSELTVGANSFAGSPIAAIRHRRRACPESSMKQRNPDILSLVFKERLLLHQRQQKTRCQGGKEDEKAKGGSRTSGRYERLVIGEEGEEDWEEFC
uniref:U2A'/phosphoprotein 32 family A C-terminal domain-containing protein n=1 Tax=Chromera velia CCMP2878 TaxID=1169474 RepID=A0A0G4G721_9ALVE|eukprot:Cvel_20520.t1-p1 / transcript=Cvel_20520.t1 / gene=Cvel_20520 / organism=Chromera_velia_CCMP2878 / gene_product=Leucine-rich repeat-containing protein 56, putative / transcript_product=Leucine-rich repeat-containing protein 56, putative / location=Cvel_scaffold1848:5337-7966(+) / protein_length=518 / sequence_SO=supercontig / SO=protein_coding / is_pseudo=false